MGLFGRGKKQTPETGPQRGAQPLAAPAEGLSDGYLEELSRCMGIAQLRQTRFADWLGGRGWEVDFTAGRISFAGDEFPIAFLGTQSELEHSWLWGADNINGFSQALVDEVTAFFEGALVRSLPEVRAASFPVRRLVDGHAMACLFVGSQPARRYCYYRCPYEGGAAFVAVKELPDELFAPAGGIELLRAARELIGAAPLLHRPLIESLLGEHCLAVSLPEDGSDGLCGELADGRRITVSFDERGRIVGMNASIAGARNGGA